MKSGLGTAAVQIPGTGLVVGAIVAVNAVGDVRDPRSGAIIAGARTPDGKAFADTMAQILNGYRVQPQPGAHTTIGVVATNAKCTKSEAAKLAQMAHDGLARTINPVHTPRTEIPCLRRVPEQTKVRQTWARWERLPLKSFRTPWSARFRWRQGFWGCQPFVTSLVLSFSCVWQLTNHFPELSFLLVQTPGKKAN